MGQAVPAPVAPEGGERAQGHGDQPREGGGQARQLQRHGQALPDQPSDGLGRAQGDAEVAGQGGAEPAEVLDVEGRVEAEEPVERLPLLRPQLGLGAQHDLDDVAGQEAHEAEDEEGDANQGRQDEDQPAENVASQGAGPPTCRARRA